MSASQAPGDADEVVRSAEGGDASIAEPPVQCLDGLPEDLILLVVKSTDTLALCDLKAVGKAWCPRARRELCARLARAFQLSTRASKLQGQGRYDEAGPLAREAVELLREKLGDRHPTTLTCIHNLGVLLKDTRDLRNAETLLREALVGLRKVLGSRHQNTLTCIASLGALLREKFCRNSGTDLADLAAAELLYREVLGVQGQTLGAHHRKTTATIIALSSLLGFVARISPLKDRQDIMTQQDIQLDVCTLRQLFDGTEISYRYTAKKFVMLAIIELEKMPSRELDYVELNEPNVFEVFTRLG